MDPAEIEMIQGKKLQKLIEYACEYVPYYKEVINKSEIGGHGLTAGIDNLPFLDKEGLIDNHDELQGVRRSSRLTKKTTGGSTGKAVTVWKTREATAQETAGQIRGFRWAGLDIGDRQGRFWGVPTAGRRDRVRAKLSDWICNRRRCSAFAFSENDMAQYTRQMNKFNPTYLYGYVSMLSRYAEYLEATKTRLTCELTAIVTTAEELTSSHRSLLERVFGVPVFNEYGCGEIGTIAHECSNNSMHVNAENMIIEILDGERPCNPGEVGEIVVTELNNLAMPLIRYRLGDFAAMAENRCECGRSLPVISEIAGRAYDLVYNREGEMFHGEFFMYIFEDVKRRGMGVRAFRVVQDTFEHFTVYLVPDRGYSKDTDQLIRDSIRAGYGAYAEVDFVQIDDIKREASGKLRLIVGLNSNVKAQS